MPLPTDSSFWPHAPLHQLTEGGVYFVTAGTYGKQHHFEGSLRLGVLCRGLLKVCRDAEWSLDAWAVFSNHYHFVAHSPPDSHTGETLRAMLARLHSRTAQWVNRIDRTLGRRVWHNFWETHISIETSLFARLQYVHENPAKHGLVEEARDYPCCSAAWLEQCATPAQLRTLRSFKIDRVNVVDSYEPSRNW